jgi:prevent-host-death family protein
MIAVTQTELRNNIRKYLDVVKRGEELDVYSHGKPVATVLPFRGRGVPSWKQPHEPLKLPGVSLSKMIIEDREDRF